MSCCVPTDIWRKKAQMLCKRGNLETELLLNKYIETLQSPTAQKRILLEAFLNESDQNLFNWLLDPEQARQAPSKYLGIIAEIRNTYIDKQSESS